MSTPANLPRRTAQQLHAPRVIAYALLFAAGAPAVYATEHTLMPSPQTVHIGYFLSSVKPVLAIDSGDIVTIESAASIVPSVIDQSGAVPPSAVPQYQRDIYGEVKDRGPGPHILTGPIEVRGAEPGDVLEVRILEINLAIDYGFNRQRSYTGALPDEFTALWTRIIPINRQAKTAEVAKGVVVALDKPFFGVMGLAPDSSMGRISSGPPGVHAGNMDNKDLVAGGAATMLQRYGCLEAALEAGRFPAMAERLRRFRSLATMNRAEPSEPKTNVAQSNRTRSRVGAESTRP
jgi:hypothetical protein